MTTDIGRSGRRATPLLEEQQELEAEEKRRRRTRNSKKITRLLCDNFIATKKNGQCEKGRDGRWETLER